MKISATEAGQADVAGYNTWDTVAPIDEGTPDVGTRGEPSLDAISALEPDLEGEHMLINIGPQHPATHGVLRLVLELDGETVVRCIPHIGYLHCGFEKIGEYRQYNQIIPWTDREDYLNSIGNNCAFSLGAERLFGIGFFDSRSMRPCASRCRKIARRK